MKPVIIDASILAQLKKIAWLLRTQARNIDEADPFKQHAAVVRLNDAATHINQAIAMLSMQPGTPAPEDLAETRFKYNLKRIHRSKILDYLYPVFALLWLTASDWEEVADAIQAHFILTEEHWEFLLQEWSVERAIISREAVDE